MKITKQQLKQIIKEELETLLDEALWDRMRQGFEKRARSGMFGQGYTQGELRGASRVGRHLTGRGAPTRKALEVAKKIFASTPRGKLANLHKRDMKNDKYLTDFVVEFFEEQGITGVRAAKVVEQIILLLTPKKGPRTPPTTPKPPEAEEGAT